MLLPRPFALQFAAAVFLALTQLSSPELNGDANPYPSPRDLIQSCNQFFIGSMSMTKAVVYLFRSADPDDGATVVTDRRSTVKFETLPVGARYTWEFDLDSYDAERKVLIRVPGTGTATVPGKWLRADDDYQTDMSPIRGGWERYTFVPVGTFPQGTGDDGTLKNTPLFALLNAHGRWMTMWQDAILRQVDARVEWTERFFIQCDKTMGSKDENGESWEKKRRRRRR